MPAFLGVAIGGPLVRERLTLAGMYSGGGWNALWSGRDLTRPDEPTLVYGADGRPQWVSGMTSTNDSDQSLVSLVYTDARTGRSVSYATRGGATEDAVRHAVESSQDVAYRRHKAALPQIYNVEGVQSAVVPLLTQADAFGGVAMVEIANPQQVAYGATVAAALDAYKAILGRHDHGAGLAAAAAPATASDVVERIGRIGADTVLLRLRGDRRILSGSVADHPTLALTQPGDQVDVGFPDAKAAVLPLRAFANRTLEVPVAAGDATASSREEKALAERAEADARRGREDDAALREKLMGLDGERLRQLLEQSSKPAR